MDLIHLKKFEYSKANTLEKSIYNRHSTRYFSDKSAKLETLSKIIWAGQGTIDDKEKRTTPSAGAIYPLELFILSKNVTGLDEGIYHYLPFEHALELIDIGDHSKILAEACFHQKFIEQASFSVIITGDFKKTKQRYSTRGERYVFMEAGHACQNMSIEATNQHLGTVVIGAFRDIEISELLNLGDWFPIAVMPFGYDKSTNLNPVDN